MSAYTFTIRATDANGKSGTRTYTINVLNTTNLPTFSLGNNTVVSNNTFFEKYQESIVGAPTFELSFSNITSNDEFFIEYEEDLPSDFEFELPGTAVTGPIAEA
jgi:hypothetical protein